MALQENGKKVAHVQFLGYSGEKNRSWTNFSFRNLAKMEKHMQKTEIMMRLDGQKTLTVAPQGSPLSSFVDS